MKPSSAKLKGKKIISDVVTPNLPSILVVDFIKEGGDDLTEIEDMLKILKRLEKAERVSQRIKAAHKHMGKNEKKYHRTPDENGDDKGKGKGKGDEDKMARITKQVSLTTVNSPDTIISGQTDPTIPGQTTTVVCTIRMCMTKLMQKRKSKNSTRLRKRMNRKRRFQWQSWHLKMARKSF
eukprot:15141548-Ditylum_brightwellii.AAC.1